MVNLRKLCEKLRRRCILQPQLQERGKKKTITVFLKIWISYNISATCEPYTHWHRLTEVGSSAGIMYMVSGFVKITAFFRFLPVIILAGQI